MQIVRWHLAATASAEASTVAPAATSGATRAGLMSCMTSSNPALTRLSAIGPPILPSPIKPTVLVIDFLLSDRGDRDAVRRNLGKIDEAPGLRREASAVLSRGLRLPSKPAATASGWRAGSRRA